MCRRQRAKSSQRKINARRQSGCLRRLYRYLRKEEKQTTREKRKIYSTECIVPGNNKRGKKAFLNEHGKEMEKNSRMRKTRQLYRKTGDIKETFHSRLGTIKDRNDKDLTEAEEIKNRKEYTEELHKKRW